MLYLIGLGLNQKGISQEGLEIVKRCKRIYLENYTVDFPYELEDIADLIGKKIYSADRELVEGLGLVDEAEKMNVALLIYGSPLTATTHISLIEEAKRLNVKYRIIYNASIMDAVAESGLQLYKFGKTASMPAWQINKNSSYKPDSFMEVIKQNKSIHSHTLLLTDIGLNFTDAIKQLEEAGKNHNINIKSLLVCQGLGTNKSKFYYGKTEDIKKQFAFSPGEEIEKPFCLVIPGKLQRNEKEFLEKLKI